jgi:uncharacterized protein (DUF952 family)
MAIILHITTRADWDAARAAGSYRPASLAAEGFIHCSTPAQAVATADRYFRGCTDLILLCIDEARVAAGVRYEPPSPPSMTGRAPDPRAGERFPHIHGPLEPGAVIRVVPFPCRSDGSFELPADTAC